MKNKGKTFLCNYKNDENQKTTIIPHSLTAIYYCPYCKMKLCSACFYIHNDNQKSHRCEKIEDLTKEAEAKIENLQKIINSLNQIDFLKFGEIKYKSAQEIQDNYMEKFTLIAKDIKNKLINYEKNLIIISNEKKNISKQLNELNKNPINFKKYDHKNLFSNLFDIKNLREKLHEIFLAINNLNLFFGNYPKEKLVNNEILNNQEFFNKIKNNSPLSNNNINRFIAKIENRIEIIENNLLIELIDQEKNKNNYYLKSVIMNKKDVNLNSNINWRDKKQDDNNFSKNNEKTAKNLSQNVDSQEKNIFKNINNNDELKNNIKWRKIDSNYNFEDNKNSEESSVFNNSSILKADSKENEFSDAILKFTMFGLNNHTTEKRFLSLLTIFSIKDRPKKSKVHIIKFQEKDNINFSQCSDIITNDFPYMNSRIINIPNNLMSTNNFYHPCFSLITCGKTKLDNNICGNNLCYILRYDNENSKLLVSQFPNTLFNHQCHSALYSNVYNCIFILSGNQQTACEYYSFNSKKWESMNSVRTPKKDAISFLYNERYIFLINTNNENELNSIKLEILDLKKFFTKGNILDWYFMHLQIDEEYLNFTNFLYCGILPIKNNVYIIGGDKNIHVWKVGIEEQNENPSINNIDIDKNVKEHFEKIADKINIKMHGIKFYGEQLFIEFHNNYFNISNYGSPQYISKQILDFNS